MIIDIIVSLILILIFAFIGIVIDIIVSLILILIFAFIGIVTVMDTFINTFKFWRRKK